MKSFSQHFCLAIITSNALNGALQEVCDPRATYKPNLMETILDCFPKLVMIALLSRKCDSTVIVKKDL